jgi:hypothetical protein
MINDQLDEDDQWLFLRGIPQKVLNQNLTRVISESNK